MPVENLARQLLFIALVMGLFFCLSGSVNAQPTPTPTPEKVKADIQGDITAERLEDAAGPYWIISLFLEPKPGGAGSSDAAAYTDEGNYKVIDITNLKPIKVDDAQPIAGAGLAGVPGVQLIIRDGKAFAKGNIYHLYASDLKFGGKGTASPIQGPIKVLDLNQTGPPQPEEPKWEFQEANGRDDANIYGSYELTSVRGEDGATTGSADIKVEIPFRVGVFKRSTRIAPFFDLKTSSNAKADPDSIKFGVEWRIPDIIANTEPGRFPWRTVAFATSGFIEAPKDFDNVNAISGNRFIAPSRNLFGPDAKTLLFIDPFGGFEIGKNLRSPLDEARGNFIFRGLFGASLKFKQPVSGLFFLKSIGFESDYSLRLPGTREITVKKQPGDTYGLLDFDKGPKHYSNSKLTLKVNEFFGPYVGFEWGRLPPNYNFVDHKWTLGLLFKTKVKP